MVTEQDLKQVYEAVIASTEKVQDSGFAYELEKAKLDVKVLEATFDGRIQGKNEGERKAVAMQMFSQDFANVDAKEYEYRIDQKALSLARLQLELQRDLIRVEELAKK